jgi:hypothetical protein
MKLAEELLQMTKIKMVEVQANINNENEQLEALQSVQKALETERDEKENELNLCKEALTILPLAQQVQSWGKKKNELLLESIENLVHEIERMNGESGRIEAKIRKSRLSCEDGKRRVDKKLRQSDRFNKMATEIRKDVAKIMVRV